MVGRSLFLKVIVVFTFLFLQGILTKLFYRNILDHIYDPLTCNVITPLKVCLCSSFVH